MAAFGGKVAVRGTPSRGFGLSLLIGPILYPALVKITAATVFSLTSAVLFLFISPWFACLAPLALNLSLMRTFFDLDWFELVAIVVAESVLVGGAISFLGLL